MMNKISNPKHYTQGSIECIEAIDAIIGGQGCKDFYRASNLQYLW